MHLPRFIRQYWYVCLGGLLVLGYFLWSDLTATETPLRRSLPPQEKLIPATVTTRHTLQGKVGELEDKLERQSGTLSAMEKLVGTLEGTLRDQTRLAEQQQARFDQQRAADAARHKAEVERARKSTQATSTAIHQARTTQNLQSPVSTTPPPAPFQLRTIGSSKGLPRTSLPPSVHAQHTAYLAAGCFAKITVVTGVQATSQVSGETWGHPMLLSLTSPFECALKLDEVGLPEVRQRSSIPLHGCLAFAHGKADLSSHRVMSAATLLSCVMPDSESYEVPIKGYLVDSDGTLGLFGDYQSHDTLKVGQAFVAGLLREATQIFSAARNTVTVGAFSGTQPFSGMENTLQQVAQLWLDQARALAPTLHIPVKKEGYLVIQRGVPLAGLPALTYLTMGTM
jgi:hypothetical protein